MSGTTAVTDNAGNGNIMMNNISIYEVNKVSLIVAMNVEITS